MINDCHFHSEHRINQGKRRSLKSCGKGHHGSLVIITCRQRGEQWKSLSPLLPGLNGVSMVACNLYRTYQQENDFPVQFFFFLLKNSKAQPQAVETQSGHKHDEHTCCSFQEGRGQERHPRALREARQRLWELPEASLWPDQLGHWKSISPDSLRQRNLIASSNRNGDAFWELVGVCVYGPVSLGADRIPPSLPRSLPQTLGLPKDPSSHQPHLLCLLIYYLPRLWSLLHFSKLTTTSTSSPKGQHS